jgi:TonB family protein
MRLNSLILVLMLTVAMACASASAAESQELPRCEKSIRIIHTELAPLQMEHPPTGRVELEFTIDPLGHVSDPFVVQSTEPRLDREALRSVVLWRYAPPSSKCRHRTSVTYEIKDREGA